MQQILSSYERLLVFLKKVKSRNFKYGKGNAITLLNIFLFNIFKNSQIKTRTNKRGRTFLYFVQQYDGSEISLPKMLEIRFGGHLLLREKGRYLKLNFKKIVDKKRMQFLDFEHFESLNQNLLLEIISKTEKEAKGKNKKEFENIFSEIVVLHALSQNRGKEIAALPNDLTQKERELLIRFFPYWYYQQLKKKKEEGSTPIK